jgi:hypothetical protein
VSSPPPAAPPGGGDGSWTAVAGPERGVASRPADGEPARQTVATSSAEDLSSLAAPADESPIPDVESSWQLPQWQYATKKARINQRQNRK